MRIYEKPDLASNYKLDLALQDTRQFTLIVNFYNLLFKRFLVNQR